MAADPSFEYDPFRVVTNFQGNLISGFPKGTFVAVEYDEPQYMYVPGIGSGMRVRNRNGSATIKITLKPNSPSNAILSAIAALDRASGSGIGVFELTELGRTVVSCAKTWIEKMPAVSFGDEVTNREWTLRTDDCVMDDSGTGGVV